MGINVACSGCQKQYHLKHDFAGKTVECKCGNRMRVPNVPQPQPPLISPTDSPISQLVSDPNPASTANPATAANPFAGDTLGHQIQQPTYQQPQFAEPAQSPVVNNSPPAIDSNRGLAVCGNCGNTRQPSAAMIGRRIKCGCGAMVTITNANSQPAGGLPNQPHPAGYSAPGYQTATHNSFSAQTSNQPMSRKEIYEAARKESKTKRKLGGNSLNSTLMGSVGMLVLGVVWLGGGLLVGYLFYFPVVMILLGIIGVIRALIVGNSSD